MPAPPLGQLFECHLGDEAGAAEIHQHGHAVCGVRDLDGAEHLGQRCSQRAVVGASRRHEPHAAMRHLPCQLDNPLGQACAVRDDHQTHSHLFLPSALHGAQKQSDRSRTWILVASAALAQVAGAPFRRHQRDGGQHALLACGCGGF